MASRAKEILEVESLEVLADKGYYNPEEIRKCSQNNTIPLIPEPKPKQFKEGNVPEPKFYENQFKYDAGMDVYTCPGGRELAYSGESIKNNKNMREYKSNSCNTCEFKSKCTNNKNGRVIFRWEHEKVLEDMRERVKNNPDSVKTVSYTHLRAHETRHDLVCRLLLEKKKKMRTNTVNDN